MESIREHLVSNGAVVHDLGEGSWVAVIKPTVKPTSEEFQQMWNSHPTTHQTIKMFGKDVALPRWQQAFGESYNYSGSTALSVAPTEKIQELIDNANTLCGIDKFNMCLVNWYSGDHGHYIGAHSDDTRQLVKNSPILGISWGATRFFVLTPKKDGKTVKISVSNGDVIVMGGRCQDTHKHSVPKGVGNRISFTMRCFE